jgi:hypothetical protein
LVEHFERNDAAGQGPTGWQQLWEMLVDRYMEEQGLEPVPQPKPEDWSMWAYLHRDSVDIHPETGMGYHRYLLTVFQVQHVDGPEYVRAMQWGLDFTTYRGGIVSECVRRVAEPANITVKGVVGVLRSAGGLPTATRRWRDADKVIDDDYSAVHWAREYITRREEGVCEYTKQ